MQSSIEFKKHSNNAIIPSLAGKDEIGFDLTIIEKVKDINSNTTMYDTKISVKPPEGFYFEIVPRSSLSKTGYMLTNSIGIIDPTYRGTLKIVVTKICENAPDMELPNKKFQLVPRIILSKDMKIIEVDDLDKTERGEGGFGSTD
tara:strand:- start:61 stop:495 length:435 start_codon:yes stop_codon:yes gene_type:complete